ncbi:MAG: hypothetical protein ABI433_15660 [Burkholderiaceae bacterium]
MLPGLAPENTLVIVRFLGDRKYAPAVPAILAVRARSEFVSAKATQHTSIDRALMQIGTTDAVQNVLDRLSALGKMSDPVAAKEILDVLDILKRLPAATRPDYAALRATLPAELSLQQLQGLSYVTSARRDRNGAADVRRLLALGYWQWDTIKTLLEVGSLEDWRAAAAESDTSAKGLATADMLRNMRRELDAALANPLDTAVKHLNERAVSELIAAGADASKGHLVYRLPCGSIDANAALRLERVPLQPICRRILATLVRQGANVNDPRVSDGQTSVSSPLLTVVRNSGASTDEKWLAALIDSGADVAASDDQGCTVLDAARDKGADQVADFLAGRGAREGTFCKVRRAARNALGAIPMLLCVFGCNTH